VTALASAHPAVGTAVAEAVAAGFAERPRRLPPWLFYDDRGSELFEQITLLPEYYLTRAERSILERHADEIVDIAARGATRPLHVVELGAGSATKTQLVLRAVVRRQGRCLYVPIDVSEAALTEAVERLQREEPAVEVKPVASSHTDALPAIRAIGSRRIVLFLGSSIGNFEDSDANALLSGVARAIAPSGVLLLGADRRKDPDVLLAAYDDASGVTAEFNLNVLRRLNRELDADFDLTRWRHRAVWNDASSCIEMHLVSTVRQRVKIRALGRTYSFESGETIHTESSAKYTAERLDHILEASGFRRSDTFTDPDDRFDLVVATVRGAERR
jgi:dimethylhistidine N-methyltransferase